MPEQIYYLRGVLRYSNKKGLRSKTFLFLTTVS